MGSSRTGSGRTLARKGILSGAVAAMAALVALAFAARESAEAEGESEAGAAQIRIESPFASPLIRADVDAEGRFAVTASADKSFTLWPVDAPNERRIERVPITPDQRKRAHAVAISPDGKLVAYSTPPLVDAAGNFASQRSSIYIVATRPKGERRIVKVLSGSADDIVTRPQALKFSPDGKFLAASLSSACGLRVWSTATWSPVYKDDAGYGNSDPARQGEDMCCRAGDPDACDSLPDTDTIVFASGGPAKASILTSGDTGVRSYAIESDGAISRRAAFAAPDAIGLERPGGIALNRAQDALAVGDDRRKERAGNFADLHFRVAVLDPLSLEPRQPPLEIEPDHVRSPDFLIDSDETAQFLAQANLNRVAWLENERGSFLVAGGVFPCHIVKPERLKGGRTAGEQASCLARWETGRRGDGPVFIAFDTDRLADVLTVPNSSGVLAVAQRVVALIDENGASSARQGSLPFFEENGFADLRDLSEDRDGALASRLGFMVSPDAKVIELDTYPDVRNAITRITFDITHRQVTVREGDSGGVATTGPDQDPEGKIIRYWRNVSRTPPLVRGKTPAGTTFGKDELFRSMALVPKRTWLLLGSSEALRVIDYGPAEPKVVCEARLREDAYRVNVTEDGLVAVTAHSDGTLRWWRIDATGSACSLTPILSAFVSRGSDGRWKATSWIPAGSNRGKFTSDLDEPLLRWQCSSAGGQVEVSRQARQFNLMDPAAVYSALDALPMPAPAGGPSPAVAGGGSQCKALAENRDRPSLIIIDRPRETLIDNPVVKFAIKLADEADWPKRLTLVTETGVEVGFTLNSQSVPARVGARVGPDMANPETGLVELEVELPLSMRLRSGQHSDLSFRLDRIDQTKKSFRWAGAEPAVKPKRRLWAIIIGMSRHDAGPVMDLRFAENDALDLARMFAGDHRAQVIEKTTGLKPDFDEVQIKLAVSPYTPQGEAELAQLVDGNPGFIEKFEPTPDGIYSALIAVQNAIFNGPAADDFVLFYFSGHGMISASGTESLFATSKTMANPSPQNLSESTISSQQLINWFERIGAQKMIVLDACRTFAPDSGSFVPERFRRQFLDKDVNAAFFFASNVGNPSLELEGITFDKGRTGARAGNGLFTYAFLEALSKRPPGSEATPFSIDIGRVTSFLMDDFFDAKNPDSGVSKLMPLIKKKQPYPPSPEVFSVREVQAGETLRTLPAEK